MISHSVSPESAIHKIKGFGASVIWRLGMPDADKVSFNPRTPYQHSCAWSRPFEPDDGDAPFYTRASLHAELLLLQSLGLIEIVEVFYLYDQYDIFEVKFCYTEAGAQSILDTMHDYP